MIQINTKLIVADLMQTPVIITFVMPVLLKLEFMEIINIFIKNMTAVEIAVTVNNDNIKHLSILMKHQW